MPGPPNPPKREVSLVCVNWLLKLRGHQAATAADAVVPKNNNSSANGGIAVRMFRRYPLSLLAALMLSMVFTVAVLLMIVEPENFNDLPKSSFSVFMTSLGIGWRSIRLTRERLPSWLSQLCAAIR